MNTPTTPRHRQVIADALTTWWMTTDPARPDLPAAADELHAHLTACGYQITRREPMPTRAGIAVTAAFAVTAAIGAVYALWHRDAVWVVVSTVLLVLFIRELRRDLAERRDATRTN